MAWQQQGAMAGTGGEGQATQPHGTEYTLQGVMRFLQLEWHSHERARNAWDIERAEMKARIAKQEGEYRSAKKLNESLDKQIRMLERALKAERAKTQALMSGERNAEDEQPREAKGKEINRVDDSVGKDSMYLPQMPVQAEVSDAGAVKLPNSFLHVDTDHADPEVEKDAQRDQSKLYLQKCVEEITYLLTPPPHPPPLHPNIQGLVNALAYANDQERQNASEDVYMQHRHKGSLQYRQGSGPHSYAPNHQQPQAPSMADVPNMMYSSQQVQHGGYASRHIPNQQPLSQRPPTPSREMLPMQHFQNQVEPAFPLAADDSSSEVERVTHSFDAYGRSVPPREEEVARRVIADDPDGWNFDDNTTLPEPPLESPLPRRPDTDPFPSTSNLPAKSPPRTGPGSHRRKSSSSSHSAVMARRRSDGSHELREISGQGSKSDAVMFKVRFALRGHLDVVRSVIFTGGGSPSEPEICTTGDDGTIKRWIIPTSYGSTGPHGAGNDLDIQSYFTHRGHEGIVSSLAACPVSSSFSTGGRAAGDGWIFSGGQDATIKVWERGRVDPKATLVGHTDAIWTVCVLPGSSLSVFGQECASFGGPERLILASGSADGTIKVWAVTAPSQLTSPSMGSRRGVGGTRRHSVTSGSNFPSSPQPSTATSTPFHYVLVHSIQREVLASPLCISPLSVSGDSFVVSFTDASVLIFDTRSGEEIIGMASLETYDGSPNTGVNCVVATSIGLEGSMSLDSGRGLPDDENLVHGATGSMGVGGVEGVVISGHEDRFIRFYDANSGQCTYSMLAHPSAIASLSLSPDGRELVSAGHDASIRTWSLEKRSCTQEITSHRLMRGEGVCSVVWSHDGKWIVSGGGDGVVKVFAR